MDTPAVMIDLDDLDQRNLRFFRWLYLLIALMSVFRIGEHYRTSGELGITTFLFVSNICTLILMTALFIFGTSKKERFSHYLRIDDEGIKLKRSLRKRQVHPWSDIARVEMTPLKLDIHPHQGLTFSIKLNDISYAQQQQVKPVLLKTLHTLSAEKGFAFAPTS